MQLKGVLQISVPPGRVASALEEPAVLEALLPGEALVEQTAPGLYNFTLRKSVGFLELRQGGTIEVAPADQGMALLIRAAHRVGGAADLSVRIGLAPGPGADGPGTRIAYDGKIQATGLAGRLLRDRADRVEPYIVRVFQRLKLRLETLQAERG